MTEDTDTKPIDPLRPKDLAASHHQFCQHFFLRYLCFLLSCQHQLRRLCLWLKPECFLAFRLEEEIDRLAQIPKALLFGFPLAIGPGHFQAGGPRL